jgi:diphthine-ammonia ligase
MYFRKSGVMNNFDTIASWSGGKDSCLALFRAIKSGVKIKYLLNFISREYKRCCFHGIESKLIQLQAEALGIALVQKEVSADMQKYEEEFKEAVNELKKKGINKMVFGDIYLLDHASWVERVCSELNIEPLEPLWDYRTEQLIEEFLTFGFKAMIVSCKADPMGKEYIGRFIDKQLITELKARGVCPCGENGEFHTFVTDGPLFRNRIEILESEPILKEGFWKHWFLDIKNYRVIEKSRTGEGSLGDLPFGKAGIPGTVSQR